MLENYKKFLKELDNLLINLFNSHSKYIKCKKGCSICCKSGEFPYSQIEFNYLTQGFLSLEPEKRKQIQTKIKKLIEQKKEYKGKIFEHDCPFLIEEECSVYEYRGIICRTFGLCYYDDINKTLKLPACVHYGLNYSENYDEKTKTIDVENIPRQNLRTDVILNSKNAKEYNIESGEIRPMLDWLIKK